MTFQINTTKKISLPKKKKNLIKSSSMVAMHFAVMHTIRKQESNAGINSVFDGLCYSPFCLDNNSNNSFYTPLTQTIKYNNIVFNTTKRKKNVYRQKTHTHTHH